MPMKATVTHLEHITEHVFELMLKPAEPLSYEPGQWLSLGLPVGPKPPTKRVYSMASPMRADHQLQLIFDHVHDGIGSTYLAGLKPGDQVEIINSMGNFILPDERPNHLLFIARYYLDTPQDDGRIFRRRRESPPVVRECKMPHLVLVRFQDCDRSRGNHDALDTMIIEE